MGTIPVSNGCTLPKLTGETARAPNAEEIWSVSWPRARRVFRRAWWLVRWKMVRSSLSHCVPHF